ncbi:PP2C family protein-serine/threonine phosphatase [Thermomonospora catenispora]|uniref:PP2C family protein-serine/threonine phosphatase n=1 Tax=Thermomonospora catenispora TaxID=2493090 RepID=UPI00112295B0|nr:fused response regulator/phosphatase [Thermomonospora catenispora]TNY35157.1 response regulator [Thermomonospora catenispora]
MSTTSDHPTTVLPGIDGRLRLLLIEDDPGDAFLVEELLADSGLDVEILHVRTLGEARQRMSGRIHCVLADLSLPDAGGLELLQEVLSLTDRAAVVVLTGLADAHLGVRAVALGAEDYLVKGEVDGPLLARAIRYAIERKRAEESERRLVEARILSRENARLERGLLPVPLIDDESLRHHARYRPGRRRALLGGDFYDTVQTDDGSVHLMIGDVCGHGPDEAALGVCLRMAWRTLVLAGHTGAQLLTTLNTVLGHERRSDELFTTVCTITVDPSLRTARMHLAGHPPPLLLDGDEVTAVPDETSGPALGLPTDLVGEDAWPAAEIALPSSWGLLLYTDGLIEGRIGQGPVRLGTEGLVTLARDARRAGKAGGALLDTLVSEVERLNGEELTDDVAVLLLTGQERH